MPSHQRGSWTEHEDRILSNLVAILGTLNWVKVADIMGTRSHKQCAERYHQHLRPGLDDSPLTVHERHLIAHFVSTKGTCWAHIARQLVNRSENKVKNWWYSVQAKLQRRERRARNHPSLSSRTAHPKPIDGHLSSGLTNAAPGHCAGLPPVQFSWYTLTPDDLAHQAFIDSSQGDHVCGQMSLSQTYAWSSVPASRVTIYNKPEYTSTTGFISQASNYTYPKT